MKFRLLFDDLKFGVDEGKVLWYFELYVIVYKFDEAGYIEIKGIFRSVDCLWSGNSGAFEDKMCVVCVNILKLKFFKKRLMRWLEKIDEERDILRIRNDYFVVEEMK